MADKPAPPFTFVTEGGDSYTRHPAGSWIRNNVITVGDPRMVDVLDTLELRCTSGSEDS